MVAAWSRSESGRRRARQLLDMDARATAAEAAADADVAVVAVPDDAIRAVAVEAASGVRPGSIAFHTSGATSVEALAPLRAAGARTGSLHPLQTLPDPVRGAEALLGAPVAVTGGPADQESLSSLARGWGGEPFLLPDQSKPVYHAAAVFASNYVMAVIHAATALLDELGLADPKDLIAPLARTSVDHALSAEAACSITGPAARGDVGTLRMHLSALRARTTRDDGDGYADAYLALAALSAGIAGHPPDLVAEAARRPEVPR